MGFGVRSCFCKGEMGMCPLAELSSMGQPPGMAKIVRGMNCCLSCQWPALVSSLGLIIQIYGI